MYAKKSLAFALCLAVTGCAHTSPDATAQSGQSWWPFGSDKVADKGVDPSVEQAVKDRVAKAEAASDAKSENEPSWWWPFGGKKEEKASVAAVAMPDPKVTKAWLDQYEPKIRDAIKDSKFELERREDLLVITAPVDSSFNPDRPAMLLPVTLGPITRVAKAVETDQQAAVLILGHADTSGASAANQKISQDRAQSVAAIFRLSGFQRNRLTQRGMGSVMPRAANDSPQGRSLNRRVEIMVTPENTMRALIAKYNQPTPTAAEMVAMQDVKAVPEEDKPVAKKAAAPAKKAAVKPVAAKKKAAPAKAAPAKKTTTAAKKAAADQQAKN